MITKVQSAQYFATQEHVVKRQQLYRGTLPYTHHLQDVAGVMEDYFWDFDIKDEDLIVSCWLHDVIEDCEVKEKVIRELFGHRVGDVVAAVTNSPGKNRAERNLLTYPRIKETEDAVLVKLADRIANTDNGGSLNDMYRKEYPRFRETLFEAKVSKPEYEPIRLAMWHHLDSILG